MKEEIHQEIRFNLISPFLSIKENTKNVQKYLEISFRY